MKESVTIKEEISRIDDQIESDSKSIRALENEILHLRERKREAETLLKKTDNSDEAETGNSG